jgi:hypothetical protein
MKETCPRCNGTGYSRAFNRRPKYGLKVKNKAIALFDKGWSYRQIATKLNIKHPQTIFNIINTNF